MLDQLPCGLVDLARGHVDVVVLDVAASLLSVLERATSPGADDAVLMEQPEGLDRRGLCSPGAPSFEPAQLLGDLDAGIDDVLVAGLDGVRARQLLRIARAPGILERGQLEVGPERRGCVFERLEMTLRVEKPLLDRDLQQNPFDPRSRREGGCEPVVNAPPFASCSALDPRTLRQQRRPGSVAVDQHAPLTDDLVKKHRLLAGIVQHDGLDVVPGSLRQAGGELMRVCAGAKADEEVDVAEGMVVSSRPRAEQHGHRDGRLGP